MGIRYYIPGKLSYHQVSSTLRVPGARQKLVLGSVLVLISPGCASQECELDSTGVDGLGTH